MDATEGQREIGCEIEAEREDVISEFKLWLLKFSAPVTLQELESSGFGLPETPRGEKNSSSW